MKKQFKKQVAPEDFPQDKDIKVKMDEVEDLLREAEEEGKWFYSPLSNKWVTPTELREHISAGRFIYERSMWRLEDPQKLIDMVSKEIKRLKELLRSVISKMNEEKAIRNKKKGEQNGSSS